MRLRNGTAHGYVRLSILYNPAVPSDVQGGSTVLAIHGIASTGNTFNPLSRALFAQSGGTIRRIVQLNLLGHGGSTLPGPSTVLKFGDMTLSDSVETLTGVIQYLQTGRNIGAPHRVRRRSRPGERSLPEKSGFSSKKRETRAEHLTQGRE